jgi:Glyoxalase-like domain
MSSNLDHIIWVCDNLQSGCSRFTLLTGVTPQFGGVHASGLTQNALVSLGGRCYLEILGPVKAPASTDDGWTRQAHAAHKPHVLTYCLRSPRPLRELAQTAREQGWKNAVVAANGRARPDGVELRWEWIAPLVEPLDWSFPFFIDWLDSPHPAESLPPRAQLALRRFSVGHPEQSRLSHALAACGVRVETFNAPQASFHLELDTPNGPVRL